MDCVNIVSDVQDFNQPPFLGSFQQLLLNNEGKTVKIDFLLGTGNLASQTGTIVSTGLSYVLLQSRDRRNYVACDIYSIKFVTFICQ